MTDKTITDRLLDSEEYAGDDAVPQVAHDAVDVINALNSHSPIECQHGRLARQCPLCERDEEIAELRAHIAELAAAQATIAQKDEALRDMLNTLTDGPDESDVARVFGKARKAIAIPSDRSALDAMLAEARKEERELIAASLSREDALKEKLKRWAELCEKGHGAEVAEEIRQAAERTSG